MRARTLDKGSVLQRTAPSPPCCRAARKLACHRGTDEWPNHSFWYVKTREYCPEEGSINGIVRFGRVDKAYIHGRNSILQRQLSRQITNITLLVERFGWKPLYSSGMIPTRSQYSLRRRARIISSILPACATSAMPLLLSHSPYPISLFVEYHNDDIFPLLQPLHPPSNTNDDTKQSPSQGTITIKDDTAADGIC